MHQPHTTSIELLDLCGRVQRRSGLTNTLTRASSGAPAQDDDHEDEKDDEDDPKAEETAEGKVGSRRLGFRLLTAADGR